MSVRGIQVERNGGQIERRRQKETTRKINLNDYKLKETHSRSDVGRRQRF